MAHLRTPPSTSSAPLPASTVRALDGPIPALFCVSGAALAVVGVLPWVATLAGAGHDFGWPLRIMAAVALLGGLFVALVGIGLLRARAGLRSAVAESGLDAELVAAAAAALAAHEPCAESTACATCDATCALNALR